MKKKLLYVTSVLCFFWATAQQPVASYFGTSNYDYANIEPASPLIHTTAGANVTWTFSGLSLNGTSTEVNTAPTAAEIATYPNTDNVHTVTTVIPSPSQVAKIYSNLNPNNVYSFTGFDANGTVLNYSTNNATLGLLPFNFGFSNSDLTAGTFINGTTTGTFTGTITTNYDAHGTLNLNIGTFATLSQIVSRVKVEQNINLTAGILGNIGTVQQITHTYYFNDNGTIRPYFRDTTYTLNIPLFNLVQTTNQAQLISDAVTALNINTFSSNSFSIYPNPVNSILNITNEDDFELKSVFIFDINGRKVLASNSKSIDVSNLGNGIYFAKIETENGTFTKKFIKN